MKEKKEEEKRKERKKEKLVMLITESGKSEVVLGGARRETGGGRNSNMRNGNSARNGGGSHVNGKSAAPALPSKRNNVGNGKAANSGPMHAENRVSSKRRKGLTTTTGERIAAAARATPLI